RRRMFTLLLILSLLVGNTALSPVSRTESATSRYVTTVFQLVQEDPSENVNLTSLSCEDRKNKTWITLQLTNSSLTSFPICLPEALDTLDLSNNLLEEVNGTEIANLPRLRALSLRQNHLWSVSWGSEVLSSLLFLDLSFNKLSSVPSCHSSSLPNLKWLSLAGNPLIEIQPLAFSCYPQLQFLNISATLLGQDDGRGIRESAFAINTSLSEATSRLGNSISVLDLSGTFLEKIQLEWTRDLPNLRSLHLTNMSRLRSLDTDFIKSMPDLRNLNCQDSHSLSFVRTEMFDSAPHLSHLSFENCNLSSFNPWNINSSDSIIISLYGNPLLCDCQLSWLLSNPKKVALQKPWETFCNTSQEDWDRPSTSFSLLELYDKCQSERNITLPNSTTSSPEHDAFSLIISKSMSNPPSFTTITTSPDFIQELYSQSSDYGSRSQTEIDELKGELRATNATFPQEGPFSQTTTEPSMRATGNPSATEHSVGATHSVATGHFIHSVTTDHYIHSVAIHTEESIPQTSPPQLNSTRINARPEPAPTRSLIHFVDDYDYEGQSTETPVQLAYTACDYNPCRHLQKPCSELQSTSQCLCPGISREDELPDPPMLREVSEVTDSSAQIRWCAPNSVVHTYELTLHVQGNEDRQFVLDNIYSTARQYTLYNLLPYTTYHICVAASNKAGSSRAASQEIPGNSCTRFKTKPSYKSIFAALVAASGLFLISTVVLSLCLCKTCKKPQSEQYSTHLVSYKNPA
ncbi:LRRN4 protein, partial [Geococcyx californianus]|nr:LRRN4 protein [Geococcyx californianus]